LVVNKGDGT